jgi:AcrR family transcriptional regulator
VYVAVVSNEHQHHSDPTLHDIKSQRTRAELLDAGVKLLVDSPATGAFAHLTAQRIATQAGRSTGAFFHQWSTTDEYVQDLVAHILEPENATTLDVVAETVGEGMARGDTATEVIMASGQRAMTMARNDPQTIAEVLLWARALRDPEFPNAINGLYDRLDAVGGEHFAAFTEHFGREIRPPFSSAVFAAVTAAVTQGLSVRRELTPGFYPDDLLGMVLVALVPLFTRAPGDDRDAAAWVSSLLDDNR